MTTTHVRVAREPPSLDDVAPTIVVDPEEPPLPPPVSPPDVEEPFEHPEIDLELKRHRRLVWVVEGR